MKKIFSSMRVLSETKPIDKKKNTIKGYVEQIYDQQIHGWVIDKTKNELKSDLKLSLQIDSVSYPVDTLWLDRPDVAAQFGNGFIRSGFTIEIPEELTELFQQLAENPGRITVIANGVALPSRVKAPSLKTDATKPPLAVDPNKSKAPASAGTVADQEKTSINGGIEEIQQRQVRGWVIDKANNNVALSLQIDGVTYPADPVWLDRPDVAAQFGNGFIRSGFTLEVAEGVAELFQEAAETVGRITVIANGVPLPDQVKTANSTNVAEGIVLASAGTVASEKQPGINANDVALASGVNTANLKTDTKKPTPFASADALENTGRASPDTVADIEETSVNGGIEYIGQLLVRGWVIDEDSDDVELSLQIDGDIYPADPIWLDRPDVAELFGNGFIRSGFTIEVPEELTSLFQQAVQTPGRFTVIANEVALPSQPQKPSLKTSIKKARPTVGRKAKIAANKKKSTINGYVERIEHIEIHGWVFDKEKTPLKLSLSIDGVLYPISPVWVERADLAAQFGNSAHRSGFKILVPEEIIDTFLLACQTTNDIDIVANNVVLPSNIKKPDLKAKEAGAELEPIPNGKTKVFSFKKLADINAKFGIDLTANDFNDLLAGRVSYPLRVSTNDTTNANHYLELAKNKLISHDVEAARTFLKICLAFEKRAEVLELLGNTYFEQRDYETAAAHYKEAVINKGIVSRWWYSNLEHCKKLSSDPKFVIESIVNGIEKNPEINFIYDPLDNLIHQYWMKQQGTLEVLAIVNKRDSLIAKMAEVSAFIYTTYLRVYGVSKNPDTIGSCNLNRILIVGDMHIPQCIRYRIDQKVEQLERAGKKVTTVSWTDLAKEQNALAFHDVVIFYRVPAEPAVLKAIAQVNATGKLSLYEIDDLLFDAAYPPAIETYGGYLDLNTYNHILKGMASFNAAARYCRFGIASTQLLADKLQDIVFGKQCFVHRNGIDSLNTFKHKPLDANKATVDIFYGSGTMAHNSDFIDLALPALDRILTEYPQTNLMIAGYLKLPSTFFKRHGGRIKQMPPVKSIRTYWSLLERADINLAVLHDDGINGCKSELKWFEAACLGLPSVMSSTANYRDVIKQGEDGLLASTAEDWYQHLKSLVENPEQRQAMAAKALARTQSEYSIDALAINISTLLAQALSAAQPASQAKRKKIALVNVFFPPQSIGGATRVLADNFDLLQKSYQDKFELSVFTSDSGHKPPYEMSVYNHQQARVYRSTILWREHMDWHCRDEKMGELFSEYLAVEQPGLIHFHCIQRLTCDVIEAAIKAKIPYVVTIHDAWWISDYQFLVDADNTVYPEGHPDPYEPYTPPAHISYIDSMERILYLKSLLHSAYKVLTVSNCFASIYRKNDITQIQVNKNGISESIAWQPKDTAYTDKVVCGHVGGMAEHKGYFLLKKAVTALQPKNIEMLIVDHSQDEGYQLQSYWGKVPVTFIGRLSQPRVVDLYRQIDVLMAPSTWPESYGLVTREAAACGCWVVASNMGGIGEDVVEGESGFVVEPTLQALTDCLQKINKKPDQFKALANPPKLRRVAEQVQELADIYSTQDTQ